MFELIPLGKQTYYIDSPTNIGVYLNSDKEVYLIDSGNDRDAGRKIRRILEQSNLILKGILNTHSHADHIGGNSYLQKHYSCNIFSPEIESVFTEFPFLEPALLYGGCPPKVLQHKNLMARPSNTSSFEDASFPKEVEVITLPGHSLNMVGFITPDNTAFIADCISNTATLAKHKVPFLYDVEAYLNSLVTLNSLKADIFLPSHSAPLKDINNLILINEEKIYEIASTIIGFCKKPLCFDDILKNIFSAYAIKYSYENYILTAYTVRSFISWLYDKQLLNNCFHNNVLLWES